MAFLGAGLFYLVSPGSSAIASAGATGHSHITLRDKGRLDTKICMMVLLTIAPDSIVII